MIQQTGKLDDGQTKWAMGGQCITATASVTAELLSHQDMLPLKPDVTRQQLDTEAEAQHLDKRMYMHLSLAQN